MKRFLWVGMLGFGLQTALAFSLLGPDASYSPVPQGDLWQIVDIGYNPLPVANVPPYLVDELNAGPKNLGEGYRRNTPVMYYAFDPSFSDWFGANGEDAVQQAFDILNTFFTNSIANGVDGYNPYLTEFPLDSRTENPTAYALGLLDVKSETLSLLLEQLGLTDAIRYTWTLHNRTTLPGCTAPCPSCEGYLVVMRNFEYYLTPLNYNDPDWGQYSPFVNGEEYGYTITENCGTPNPPDADAFEIPVDYTIKNPPVASGLGEGPLNTGIFYTGLTRDDAAGLRWLYSTNNYDTASASYQESPAAGSIAFITNYDSPQLLYTSNLNLLVAASLTNSPTALQALYPGLIVGPNPYYYFSNVVSESFAYVTNTPIGGTYGQQYISLQTNYTTNIVQFYQNTFANVVTNNSYSHTTYAIQTITYGPPIGWPIGTPFTSNVTYQPFQSNIVSGDYFILSNGVCGPNVIQTLQTNVEVVTNLLAGTTNPDGSFVVQNLISYSTNYALVVQPCTEATNAVATYQGVGKIHFVRIPDYDYQNGFFTQPLTNQYSMVLYTNGQYVTRWFQRVLTTPDFVLTAQDMENGPSSGWIHGNTVFRNVNFNQANELAGHAGPGIIDSPTTITYDEVGPDYENESSPYFLLNGPDGAYGRWFIWGSFDGTTNAPVVYPNGTSITNLAAEAMIQISPPPPNLPTGAKGVPYNVAMTVVAGGDPGATFTWTLASGSGGLPPGLTLSTNGVISGTPTKSDTFDNIVIQMTETGPNTPIARVMNLVYSITIN